MPNEPFTIEADLREITRAHWLELRRGGIGGSDAGAVMGVSPWGSPLSVWADKRGILPERDETDEMTYGKKVEPVLREWLTERLREETHGNVVTVSESHSMVRSTLYPWAIADIDGIVDIDGAKTGAELKTADRSQAKHWRDGELPDGYYYQCQHYMAVFADWPGWHVFCLLGKRPITRYVPRSDSSIKHLMEAECRLWEMVQANEMPAPTGLDVDSDILAALYQGGGDETVDCTPIAPLLERHVRLGQEIKECASIRDELSNQIKASMGNAKSGIADGYKATWSRFVVQDFNEKLFKKEQPAMAAKYTKPKDSSRFTVARKGEKE